MTSIAHQLRAARRRRERRRRVLLTAAVIALAVVWAVRLVAEVRSDVASAMPIGTTVPPTSAAVVTTTTAATDLRPGLVDAFRRARAAAADAGEDLTITSGFRTAEEQAAMLEDEIAARGSRAEALWWVFPPDRSMHVQGLAIDVGDGPAADWLAVHGDRFGLCRTLSWEWWHFEWRPTWEADGTCPRPAHTPDEAPRA